MKREDILMKIKKLKEDYKANENDILDIQWEISSYEDQISSLEVENSSIINEIEKLKESLKDIEFKGLDNKLTGDSFRDSFIKASHFCAKYSELNSSLLYVKITENELIGTDGYRGIIIKCDDIPNKLRNSFIKGIVRDNFEANIRKDTALKFYDIQKIIEKDISDILIELNERDFRNKLHLKDINNGKVSILEYNSLRVAFNKEFLETFMVVFKEMDLKVYFPKNELFPLVVKSKNQQALLLPVRIQDLNMY